MSQDQIDEERLKKLSPDEVAFIKKYKGKLKLDGGASPFFLETPIKQFTMRELNAGMNLAARKIARNKDIELEKCLFDIAFAEMNVRSASKNSKSARVISLVTMSTVLFIGFLQVWATLHEKNIPLIKIEYGHKYWPETINE